MCLKIGGFKKQSLIDYPGNISSVIFTQGCNFRCGYCHNPNLVLAQRFEKTFRESIILDYLKQKNRLLDAVCITGGEPTLHKSLPAFIKNVKNLGLKVKLDTNGTNPTMLQHLLGENLIDFVAMDIKHLLETAKYKQVAGHCFSQNMLTLIKQSIQLLQNTHIDYEFRTTVIKNIHTPKDISALLRLFDSNYRVNNFQHGDIISPKDTLLSPFSSVEFKNMVKDMHK